MTANLESPAAPRAGRRRFLTGFALLAALTAVALLIPRVRFRTGEANLGVLLLGSERMMRGEAVYRTDRGGGFTYPPLFAVALMPLLVIPEPARRSVWYLLNLLVLLLILAVLRRRIRPALPGGAEGPKLEAAFWALLALLAARHLISPIENQSHDLVLFLLVMLAVDASCSAAEERSGLLAGLAAACKATPLLFAPVFLWQGRWRAVVALAFAAAGGTLLADVLFPAKSGELWITQWYRSFGSKVGVGESADTAGAWTRWDILNQGLPGTIHRLSAPPDSPADSGLAVEVWDPGPSVVKGVTVIAQLAVLAWLVYITRSTLTRRAEGAELALRRLGEGGAILTAMVLLSPMSSKAHFCVLVVPLAFCLADFLHRRGDRVVASLLLVTFVFSTLTAKDLIGRAWGNRILAAGSITWCALASLLATGYVLLRRSKEQ